MSGGQTLTASDLVSPLLARGWESMKKFLDQFYGIQGQSLSLSLSLSLSELKSLIPMHSGTRRLMRLT